MNKLLQHVKFEGGEKTPLPTREELVSFEARHGLKLPEDYRNFLLKVNGGMPSPSLCLWPDGGDFVAVVYGFHHAEEWMRLEQAMTEFDVVASGYLPVAISNGGNYFLLSLKEADAGSIHFWDHELEDVDPVMFEELVQVAPSFSHFVNNLVEAPAEDESIHPLDI